MDVDNYELQTGTQIKDIDYYSMSEKSLDTQTNHQQINKSNTSV